MPLGMQVGLSPDDIVLDGDPTPTHQKGGHSSPHICGPCLLWPNSWMDSDATWYGGTPRPRRLCVRLGPSSPKKGAQPPLFDHVYCGQTAGWIKMPLGMEAGLGPGHIVLVQLPPKGAQPPQFSAHVCCGQTVAHLSY